ncbi:enoyl-CoA hydratase/isomerase family protein, partial [Thermodesulfobacteriota bacterium]
MSYSTILWEIEDGIATLTFNRPEKLNAINNVMAEEIVDALSQVQDDEDIKVLVIKSTGRAFCAGADIKERFLSKIEKKKKNELWDEAVKGYTETACLTLANISKPVIAAINGIALGLGATLILGCDIRLASEKASIG